MNKYLPSCDTMVALGTSTKSGKLLFAKNSDRPITESQPLVTYPAASYPAGRKLKCTYISVEQAEHTYRVIGSRPWWIWGFEHGINEHGVVIGNEAAWSNVPTEESEGLLGMDLLRLGLERGKNAHEAMHVITALLEKHGQGGQCAWGPQGADFRYHNLFIIADPGEAWVLETVERHWVAKKVVDFACISNMYTIRTDFDESSTGLEEFAIAKGLHIKGTEFDFAKSFTKLQGGMMSGFARVNRVRKLLEQGRGRMDAPYMMRILRDHFEGEILESSWSPAAGFNPSVCMHGLRPGNGQTAASVVVDMHNSVDGSELLFTYWGCLCTPCISFFVPFYNTGYLPAELSQGSEKYDEGSLWWNAYRMCLGVEANYEKYANSVHLIRNELEKKFREIAGDVEARAADLLKNGNRIEAARLLDKLTDECLARVIEARMHLTEYIEIDLKVHPGQVYRAAYLKELKQETQMPV